MSVMSQEGRSAERAHIHTYIPSLFIIVMSGSLIIDTLFPNPIYATLWAAKIGSTLAVLGTILLYAAHVSSKKIRKEVKTKEVQEVNFFVGPYAYVRHPGYLGMVLIGIGLSFIFNSTLILVNTIIFYLIARIIAVQEEKHLLHEDSHVREEYGNYTKRVKRFF
jgi:protein-S-isoprenylcysteine O-methyltransferase Ste14